MLLSIVISINTLFSVPVLVFRPDLHLVILHKCKESLSESSGVSSRCILEETNRKKFI